MIVVIRKGSSFDGVEKFQVRDNAIETLEGNPLDIDNFYPFDGDEFSYSIGDVVRNIRKRKNLKAQSKADARRAKASAKLEQAKSQTESAKALSDNSGDIALASALKTTPSKSSDKKGLSTGAKVGIGLGVAVVLGIATYFVIKHKKKK